MGIDNFLVPERNIFGGETCDVGIRGCRREGYDALFMPEIIDKRINTLEKDDGIWQNQWLSLSIGVTGKTEGDEEVAIYAHIPNYFSDPENIITAIQQGLVQGGGIYPQDEFQRLFEFQRLLDSEGSRRVFVVKADALRKWPNFNSYGINEPTKEHMEKFGGRIDGIDMVAINHPHIVAFLGGRERADKYLQRVNGTVGICYSEDFTTDRPIARLLEVSSGSVNRTSDKNLNGLIALDSSGFFFGEPSRCEVYPLETLKARL